MSGLDKDAVATPILGLTADMKFTSTSKQKVLFPKCVLPFIYAAFGSGSTSSGWWQFLAHDSRPAHHDLVFKFNVRFADRHRSAAHQTFLCVPVHDPYPTFRSTTPRSSTSNPELLSSDHSAGRYNATGPVFYQSIPRGNPPAENRTASRLNQRARPSFTTLSCRASRRDMDISASSRGALWNAPSRSPDPPGAGVKSHSSTASLSDLWELS